MKLFNQPQLDQMQLWRELLGMPHLELNSKFCNPFRMDRNPGCYFKVLGDNILMVDWGDVNYHNVSIFSLMKRLNFKVEGVIGRQQPIAPFKFYIEYTKGRWKEDDIRYWEEYGITIEQLEEDNVYPVAKYCYNTKKFPNQLITKFPVKNVYAIEVNGLLKIYRPFMKPKVLCNFNSNTIGGDPNPIIYTKSYKDYRVIKNLGLDVPVGFIHAESIKNPPKGIYIVDGDAAGIKYALYLKSISLPALIIPTYKDPAEAFKRVGREGLLRILNFQSFIYGGGRFDDFIRKYNSTRSS